MTTLQRVFGIDDDTIFLGRSQPGGARSRLSPRIYQVWDFPGVSVLKRYGLYPFISCTVLTTFPPRNMAHIHLGY